MKKRKVFYPLKRKGGDSILERVVLDMRREQKDLLKRQEKLEAFVFSNMPRRRRRSV